MLQLYYIEIHTAHLYVLLLYHNDAFLWLNILAIMSIYQTYTIYQT